MREKGGLELSQIPGLNYCPSPPLLRVKVVVLNYFLWADNDKQDILHIYGSYLRHLRYFIALP